MATAVVEMLAAKLANLRRSSDEYPLNPPVSERELCDFEAQHRIRLPEDYRDFLLTMGNGGPAGGVVPLGCNLMDEKWGEDYVGDLAKPFPYTEAWNLPPERFEAPEFEDYEDQDEWQEKFAAEYYVALDGAIPLADYGCGTSVLLIVTGNERGKVWWDNRAEDEGLSPYLIDGEKATFAAWYEEWLDQGLTRK